MMIENPILRGFSPDPSIVRVGEDYFIATSTFEWFPGVRLHHSRDLVHWRELRGVLTRPGQLDLRGVPDSGGVWAPSLSHADGLFWLVYTNVRTCGAGRPFKDLGVYLVTAPDITGPWSEPVPLTAAGFDPSLFHDADGRKWLVNMQWDHRQTGLDRFAGIVVQEYDPRVGRMVGPMTRILQKPVLCEGPNLYRRSGWYYLMTADGGTGWDHGIAMARSRNLTGPYELDPAPAVLTTRDARTHPLQKAGHGELVETRSGEWYLVHLASRPVGEHRRCILGRETCLQRVEWTEEGWLRLEHADRRASVLQTPALVAVDPPRLAPAPWHPAVRVPAAAGVAGRAEPGPSTSGSSRDDFDGIILGPRWRSLRGPVAESWASLNARPGWLRLRGRESLHSLFDQSLLAQPLRSARCVVETCLEFAPRAFTEMAGLVCYYDTRTHYYCRVTHDEVRGRVLGVVQTDDGVYREPDASTGQIAVGTWPRMFLRATFDEVNLQFSASPDGHDWQCVGPVLDATKLSDDYGSVLHFTGAMIGLCAQDLAGNGALADFDYFAVNPNHS